MSAPMEEEPSLVSKELLGDFIPENEKDFINLASYVTIITGAIVALILQFIRTPYGRYGSSSWGVLIPSRVAWLIQELPALFVPVYLIFCTDSLKRSATANQVLLSAFIVHYFQRALIYPCLIKGGKPTPFIPFFLALVYCTFNGYLQARFLLQYADYPNHWVLSPNFIIGLLLFGFGMFVNIHSDHVLRNLRKPGETGYKIPRGGMFEYVSGANFFGECLEWTGFAIACWSLPALAFCIFTWLNTGPRAFHHHQYYLEKFDDYPKERKALLPFLM
ncbi:3-oxo-5-alpha-steroid 4-dehydrogenase 1 [Lingula anatina]|uniref:3-oxo-5alpha-steroid 4-dehydrogenase (NADP(+)) n=1 Tax=Lingula anatina TaxID=7574 RepID=A0A1S3KCQ5_LINAN|nr:3-oxo-5-alpha-steroid 4-dehydrogenase 1 [Lingula anatina]|eukprot:XP_013420420.1 3-oxo-5-alpha-steroid 4-dehydrogenase 1 [Lingula anatina]